MLLRCIISSLKMLRKVRKWKPQAGQRPTGLPACCQSWKLQWCQTMNKWKSKLKKSCSLPLHVDAFQRGRTWHTYHDEINDINELLHDGHSKVSSLVPRSSCPWAFGSCGKPIRAFRKLISILEMHHWRIYMTLRTFPISLQHQKCICPKRVGLRSDPVGQRSAWGVRWTRVSSYAGWRQKTNTIKCLQIYFGV